ncbi:MAG TPA: T9SS type A sorting domain-containing protein, partial [Flavipsychrobacter sp.]|nr:T9SS type A sorting domain-containing protein [Flavipsychrobacter sp.]
QDFSTCETISGIPPLRLVSNYVAQESDLLIGESKSGQITVYDILGRFIDEKKVNGEQFYNFNLSAQANGSYILHYVSQERNLTRKIEILK